MRDSEVRVILATVTPRPGKLDRIIELYQGIIQYAEANEPACLEFQLFTEVNAESGVEEIFTIERFKTLGALRAHQRGPALEVFNQKAAEEDLLAKELVIKVVRSVSGFVV